MYSSIINTKILVKYKAILKKWFWKFVMVDNYNNRHLHIIWPNFLFKHNQKTILRKINYFKLQQDKNI